jgi:hypothetical protein
VAEIAEKQGGKHDRAGRFEHRRGAGRSLC